MRKKYFIGLPDMVVNYFTYIAQETRVWMSKLGVRSMEELIGRTDLLSVACGDSARQQRLDLQALLNQGHIPDSEPRYCMQASNPSFDTGELAEKMVSDAAAAIRLKQPLELRYDVRNVNRSLGARLSGEIARTHGAAGLPANSLTLRLNGSAGQSFGVWNAPGLQLLLEGDANDYVGKGMAGGRIVIRPHREAGFIAKDAVIIGNTCLYGATGGHLFAAGIAGERFAVRNSGAKAIVEGAGDHCCEYMTGGYVVVLGQTGLNFGAGMTGGFALVYDQEDQFAHRYNNELVDIHRINNESMGQYRAFLRDAIEEHVAHTESQHGRALLAEFADVIGDFWLVKPKAVHLDSLLK